MGILAWFSYNLEFDGYFQAAKMLSKELLNVQNRSKQFLNSVTTT